MADSVAEVRLVRRLVANRLPEPKLQHEVYDTAGRFVARLDLAYPGDRVGLEMNGFRWHATPLAYARDQERLRRLAALGWLVLPATPLDLAGDGSDLAAQVAAARQQSSHASERSAS